MHRCTHNFGMQHRAQRVLVRRIVLLPSQSGTRSLAHQQTLAVCTAFCWPAGKHYQQLLELVGAKGDQLAGLSSLDNCPGLGAAEIGCAAH